MEHHVQPVRILGIDPGLRRTGWGLITAQGSKLTYGACGVVTSTSICRLALRLRELFEGIGRVVEATTPNEVAVEETFVNKDAQATLKLGHARAMALVVPALAGLPVFEYAANLIKKTVAGSGHAGKAQIQAMVRFLLPKAEFRVADAADALAIAITHASHRDAGAALRQARLPGGGKRRGLTGQAAAGLGLEGQGFSAAAAARIEAALAKQG